ncbi:MAG: flagellar basal body L-ring protein FlgH [Brevinematales bacterium]|nr:flagellar basal body L-ring protein FlgH [Brevinematales bacterium]
MKDKLKIIFLGGVFLLFSTTIWKNGNIFYKQKLREGDIITVRFSDKAVMKYRIENKNSAYLTKKGKKGSGNLFSFFPDIEAKENDTTKNSQNWTVNNENNFLMKAKVISIDGDYGVLEGNNSIIIDGEKYGFKLSGEFVISDLEADNSIFSTDIYNLNFELSRENLKKDNVIGEGDIVFQTNYNEIITNRVFDPTNNVTNIQITTNMSSFEIKLKGISEEKKREIIINYVNSILTHLFK